MHQNAVAGVIEISATFMLPFGFLHSLFPPCSSAVPCWFPALVGDLIPLKRSHTSTSNGFAATGPKLWLVHFRGPTLLIHSAIWLHSVLQTVGFLIMSLNPILFGPGFYDKRSLSLKTGGCAIWRSLVLGSPEVLVSPIVKLTQVPLSLFPLMVLL